ncbi:Hypothetical Protein FCC1311_019862 [Hondaea fermentalgiana]|uniref:BAR domain-containing protein n=1 Tax=Hondaea fermentalgiana TaxID=2315210 RepID=A0A2R5G404_9STRA|nr:Hypothetical Protein FCC1311_019862 [Hondaea fermentalgiana]|eukprot:GBG25767.1 Hypothetical Protein FCC1311_019862 [Hondaea fermentalgiana]
MVAGAGGTGASHGNGAGHNANNGGVVTTLKKTKRRTTEKILQKLGASEPAHDDKEFNELHGEFADTHKEILLLLSKFQLYVEAIEKWQRCGEALAKEVGSFVANGQDHECEARKGLEEVHSCFAATQDEMSAICSNLVDKWSVQILSPLRDVAFKLNNTVKDKVAERAADKIDFDVYRRRAKSLAGQAGSKGAKQREAQKNFSKLSATQQRYEENNAFLLEQFRRMREERSLVVLHELALSVHFQNEFVKSMQRVSRECFQDTLEAYLPDEEVEGYEKRRNQWVVKGGTQAQKAAGYDTVGALAESGKHFAGKGPKHYARNAPRGKQVFLKNIGRQLSMERKQPTGKKTDFVLPNKEELTDISIVSYKSTLPLEAPVTPVHLKSKSSTQGGFPLPDDASTTDQDSAAEDQDAGNVSHEDSAGETHEADLSAVEEEDDVNYLSSAKSGALHTTSSEHTIETVDTDDDDMNDEEGEGEEEAIDEAAQDLTDEAKIAKEGRAESVDSENPSSDAQASDLTATSLPDPEQQSSSLHEEADAFDGSQQDAQMNDRTGARDEGEEDYEDDFEEAETTSSVDAAATGASHSSTPSADKNIVRVMDIDCMMAPGSQEIPSQHNTTTA